TQGVPSVQINGQPANITPGNRVLKSRFKKAFASVAAPGSALHMLSIPQPRTSTSQPTPPVDDGSRCATRTVTPHETARLLVLRPRFERKSPGIACQLAS